MGLVAAATLGSSMGGIRERWWKHEPFGVSTEQALPTCPPEVFFLEQELESSVLEGYHEMP